MAKLITGGDLDIPVADKMAILEKGYSKGFKEQYSDVLKSDEYKKLLNIVNIESGFWFHSEIISELIEGSVELFKKEER